MAELEEHIEPDLFHKSTVCSVYYDNDSFSLIRRSIDAPVYKEKLRVRSYGVPEEDGQVFVELKKKFDGIVYKRRIAMSAAEAEGWLAGKLPAPEDSQMVREIEWFMRENSPSPRCSSPATAPRGRRGTTASCALPLTRTYATGRRSWSLPRAATASR